MKTMSRKHTELEVAVDSLVEEGRSRLGPEPSEKELLSYHRGELSEEEADRFEERLAHYPASARLLATFVEDEQPSTGDPDFVTEGEKEAAWETLRERVGIGATARVPTLPTVAPQRNASTAPASALSWPMLLWPVRIAAAGLLILLGVLWYVRGERIEELGRQVAELREPQINAEQRRIAPDARRRGEGGEPVLRLPPSAHPYLLTLALYEAPSFPDYRLEIVPADDSQTEPFWARSGLMRKADDTFSLYLPRGSLPPGRYELRLYGMGEGPKELLATYTVEV